MKTMRIITAVLLAVLMRVSPVQANCDCGSTDPANPCYGNTASRVVGPATVTFSFNADGEDCACGRFVNGEVWVAPLKKSGGTASAVTITNITPTGTNNGAHSNLSNRGTSQGLLPRWGNYNASDNVMTKLPYAAKPGEVILKAVERPQSSCGTNATKAYSCSDAYDAITVLAEVPEDCGSTLFRPPYAGTDKPLRSINNIQWDRLPQVPMITALSYTASFTNIINRWSVPTCDIIREGGGEIYRGFTAHGTVGNDYAGTVAATYLNDLLSVYGTESESEKARAVYALMQPGFDNYEVYKLGIKFGSGAGQHLGKKPQIVFAAAMYDDPEMLTAIRGAAAKGEESWFQEDKQISFIEGKSTTPVWGDGDPSDGEDYWYWVRFGYDNSDNKKTHRDPYGYIDGPAHGVNGSSYQYTSSPPFASFVFAQHLMPWLEYANNDWEIVTYIDRLWNGRGIDNFSGGWWGSPDPCAPKLDGSVKGVDYGPDPNDPGDCIKDGKGRFPDDHGTYVSPGSWSRLSRVTLTLWQRMRDCTDPDHPTYPCAGMGPEVESNALFDALRKSVVQSKPAIRISPNPSTGHIFINGNAKTYLVYDHAGRIIQTIENQSAFLPRGVYTVTDEDHTAAVRVMVVD